jgi:hypothetical protein
LSAIRACRAACKAIATKTVSQALSEAGKTPGVGKLDFYRVQLLFVAAMRRELRKSGLF